MGSAFDLDHEGRCTMETATTEETMAEDKMSGDQITFEAPGPGSWMLDTTHHGRRPLTRYIQPLYLNMFVTGMPLLLDRYGLPLKEFRAALVNGCFYVRPMGIGEPESPGKEPPAFVLKIVSRVHPQLRRRNRTARQAWSERRWREDVDRYRLGAALRYPRSSRSSRTLPPQQYARGVSRQTLVANQSQRMKAT